MKPRSAESVLYSLLSSPYTISTYLQAFNVIRCCERWILLFYVFTVSLFRFVFFRREIIYKRQTENRVHYSIIILYWSVISVIVAAVKHVRLSLVWFRLTNVIWKMNLIKKKLLSIARPHQLMNHSLLICKRIDIIYTFDAFKISELQFQRLSKSI